MNAVPDHSMDGHQVHLCDVSASAGSGVIPQLEAAVAQGDWLFLRAPQSSADQDAARGALASQALPPLDHPAERSRWAGLD